MAIYVLDHDAYLQIDNDGVVSEHEKSLIVTGTSGTDVLIYIDGLGTGEAFIKSAYTNFSYPTGANAAAVKAAIDAKLTIDDLRNPTTGSGANTYVAYWSSASNLTGEAAFAYDAANNSLSVAGNVTTPIVIGSTSASGTLTLRATSSGTDGAIIFETDPTTERVRILSTGEFIVGAATLLTTEFISFQKNANANTALIVSNTTSGTAGRASMQIRQSGTDGIFINSYSTGYTTSGISVASSGVFSTFGKTNGCIFGTADAYAAEIWTNATKRIIVPSVGGLVVGTGALATTATDGFLYIPTCAGTPTGVPTARTGTVAMVFDTTNNKLYIYDGGWLGGTTPGAFT